MNTGYFLHLERCCIILLVHGLNCILLLIISIFAFLVVMHDKFGVLELSERWIQCICKKRIMLNKPCAVNFFEGSKSVKVGNIFLLNPVTPKIWKVTLPSKTYTILYVGSLTNAKFAILLLYRERKYFAVKTLNIV